MGPRVRILLWVKLTIPFILLVGVVSYTGLWKRFVIQPQVKATTFEEFEATEKELFSHSYPVSKKYQQELKLIRHMGKLPKKDEILLHRSIAQTSFKLEMPPAILWCLFFQESRLNHLSGIGKGRGIYGLGQFSYFGFYEINHQINQYNKSSLASMTSLLGGDFRPIEANQNKMQSPSSYYNIPTAVVSSALYFNNRYSHLKKLLHKHDLNYDPELLWLYAAMAYNKGSRSVLSYWNLIRRVDGEDKLESLLIDKKAFFKSVETPYRFSQALQRIWSKAKAIRYAKELSTHMKNIISCSIERKDS